MNKILILGADGFLGKAMVQKLALHYSVRAFDLSAMNDLRRISNVECVQGNYLEIRDYGELFKDVDCVCNFICTTAPKDQTSQIPNEIETNLIPLTVLLDNLIRYQIDNFMFVSTAGVIYGNSGLIKNNIDTPPNPICSYGVLKQTSEAYINFYNARYNKKFKIARLSNPYGIGQNIYKTQGIIPIFVNKILNEEEITIFGNGSNVRDYIYIDDAIDGLLSLLEYNGQQTVFHIANGTSVSTNDIVKLIEKSTGKNFKKINYAQKRICDVINSSIDTEASNIELNWTAKTDIYSGISKILKLFEDQS